MKFNFFNKNEKNRCGCNSTCKDEETSDCACGCTPEARDSVRLTDAEIANDVIYELDEICKEYACLCKEGCDCTEKLQSCEECKDALCDYMKNRK